MSSRRASTNVSQGFLADMRVAAAELSRKTSGGHKRMVFLFLVTGIVLRASLLSRPVSLAEAASYMEFATQPLGGLLSDYAYPTNHILHSLLTKVSTGILGMGVVQLRLPAFLAGVLCMPLFYLFIRAMFNRYIALITLAIVACSGPLISIGTQAVGYSLCWLSFTASLLLGRHFIKTNDLTSILLIALSSALGTWSVPAFAYGALAVYVWLLIALMQAYDHSLRERVLRLVLSFVVFILLGLALYSPVLQEHGFDQLINHHTYPRLDWVTFDLRHTDMAFALWSMVVDGTSAWIAVLGLVGLVHAAFISSKYRTLVFAAFISAVILCLFMRRLEPAEVWGYLLFLFHLSSGIAVFYLLKFMQEKIFPAWGKRTRTSMAAVLLAPLFAIPGFAFAWDRSMGLPEVQGAVAFLRERMHPGDMLYVQHPWDAPFTFVLRTQHADESMLNAMAREGYSIHVVVAVDEEQTPAAVLRHYGQDPSRWPDLHVVQGWPSFKIYAAP